MKRKAQSLVFGFSFMLAAFMSIPNVGNANVEEPSLAGERIICSCTIGSNCKASGSSGVCAQSEPGGNIQCSSYNSNC